MQEFTATRGAETPDELWLCEHPPVFTQGLSGKPEHLLRDIGIPVVQIDRGGQITYHGPPVRSWSICCSTCAGARSRCAAW
jgi:lipoyl(octanoyl) transferase